MPARVKVLLLFPLIVFSVAGATTTLGGPIHSAEPRVLRLRVRAVPSTPLKLGLGSSWARRDLPGRDSLGPAAELFAGSFSGPVTWTSIRLSRGIQSYTLTGVSIGGRHERSVSRAGMLRLEEDKKSGDLPSVLPNGYSLIGTVPEPSGMWLLLTGVLGMLPAVRRKIV